MRFGIPSPARQKPARKEEAAFSEEKEAKRLLSIISKTSFQADDKNPPKSQPRVRRGPDAQPAKTAAPAPTPIARARRPSCMVVCP
jgi:hypothetical protein